MDPLQSRADAQSLDQLALLYSMVDHIQRARRVEHVYQEAAEGMRQVLSVDRSALLVQDGRAGMRVKASGGFSAPTCRALEGYAPWSREDRDPRALVFDELVGVKPDEPVYDALRHEGIRSLAWVPLVHRGRLMGELLLGTTRSRPFQAAELRLAEVIAGHVAFSIWRARSDQDQAELLQRFEAERSVLESVVNQMPAGVLLADAPSGRIITSNPQVAAIWGKTLRHAARVSDYGMWGGRGEDGQSLDPHCWPLARSVEHGETVRGEEIRIDRADGGETIVRMSSAPVLDSRGRQLAAVATVYDVTGEREQERRQAFLEDATQELNASIELAQTLSAIARVGLGPDGDWCLLFRSGDDESLECAEAYHRDPARAESLRPLARRVLEPIPDHPVQRALREGQPLLLGPDPHVAAGLDPEGEVARELAGASLLVLPLVARDQRLGALAVGRTGGPFHENDLEVMSELARRASLALENALLYERARAADRAKSSFLAVMSHEFRTPLSAILGYADILTAQVHGELTSKQQMHLDRVKASVRHLSHLVDEILSFASMEAGRERVVRRRTDLRALVVDTLGIMDPIAEAAGLSLSSDIPEDPIWMSTDSSKVRQILINLVSNALKYTPAGSVRVRLEEDGSWARCAVTDTGPGIAPEHLERVFEPFWQVDQSDGSRVTGTGLGLAVARRLAQLLGGDLTLESEVGAGSTFTLALPLEPPGVAADPPA